MAIEDNRRVDLPPDLHTPAIDTLRANLTEDVQTLVELTRSRDVRIQKLAIRAIGRFERRELVPTLLQFIATDARAEAFTAIAQSMKGMPLSPDTASEQVQGVLDALVKIAEVEQTAAVGQMARDIARLPFSRAEQVRTADAFLLRWMQRVDANPEQHQQPVALDADFARAIDTLARVHIKLAAPGADTLDWLRRIVLSQRRTYPAAARTSAMMALVAARGVDAETLRVAAAARVDELRRLATVSLGAAGSAVPATERTDLLKTLLADSSLMVRIEAVRAWGRQEARTSGCQQLLDAAKDQDLPVVLMAIDTLGDACQGDVSVTDWLAAEARTPPAEEWHRASHALVSLAKRAPEKVPVVLMAHVSHATWQVRMYAARAASATNNVPALERLSLDEHPNVREATLAALRRHKGADADPAFVSALGMSDYQLLRTAATELKGASTNSALVTALVEALRRVTSEQRDTSRDPRLALLDRIAELGSADDAGRLVPLLRDFDIRVATAAGAVLQQWTGTPQEVAPVLLSRPPLPLDVELKELREVPARVEMASGKVFGIALDPDTAPLASVRFHRLVKAGYYTGLTWHRTVPNFVLQGGSPGANEYVGDGPYLRDELDTAANVRGSVGLSTRGRDTGDAQIYFNLVDNARLDYDYTVVGTVGGTGMDVVDRIVEGDRIKAITFDRKKE